ncbi:MAG: hypothetical protein HYT71_03360 [Candidatus Aenigmarchaeota archaeon]|nr:hypothetical protein [Candidatus Aenigmarchaeota archaeon]
MKNKSRLKGQFYIITALVLILFMFYAHYNSRFEIPKSVDYSQEFFSSLKEEILRSASFAYYQGPYSSSVENNVSVFLDFSTNVSNSQGQRMEAIVLVFLPIYSSYNVSVINFLGAAADVNVTISGNEQNTTNLENKGSARFVFTGVEQNATVNVTYVKSGSKNSDVFNLTSRRLNAYADVKLISSSATWSDKVIG